MNLLVDPAATKHAKHIATREYADQRRYYLVDNDLIIVRNGYDLDTLRGRVVDAQVGWDIAQPGFCRERDVGRKRTKVTIYRASQQTGHNETLSTLLEQKEPPAHAR